jgi:hypothetical protein
MVEESAQGLIFPRNVVEQFGVRPGWKDPEARLYKKIAARQDQLPNPAGWYHQGLVASAYHAPSIICSRCHFENVIESERPAPKTRLSSNHCMQCNAELTCPVCCSPLEIKSFAETEQDLCCTNDDCDVWILIW